ncbi:hypothetical protein [Streptomyces sp. NPDC096339]
MDLGPALNLALIREVVVDHRHVHLPRVLETPTGISTVQPK